MKMLQMCEVHLDLPEIMYSITIPVHVVYRVQVHHDVYMYLTRCAVE